MKKYYELEDLDCANCAAKMEAEVQRLDGVRACSITFMTKKMVLELEEAMADQAVKKIRKVIKKIEPDVEMVERKR